MATAILSKGLALVFDAPHIVTTVEDAVLMVERLFGKNTGQSKKQAALMVVTDLLEVYRDAEGVSATLPQFDVTAVEGLVGKLVDDAVALYNALGVFPKGQAAAAAPAAAVPTVAAKSPAAK